MINHIQLGNSLFKRLRKLKILIDNGQIQWGGNKKLKIYGTLTCNSGKRMLDENRIFFISEKEALDQGYRPCGHCLRAKYKIWRITI